MRKMPLNLYKPSQKHRVFLVYGLVGASGILVDLVLFNILMATAMNPVWATLISTSVGITNNFIWNARLTFKRNDQLWGRFLSFFAVGAGGIVISAATLLLFADLFAFDAFWVKVLSIPPIVLGQFWLNKHISFGRSLPSPRRWLAFLQRHRPIIALCIGFILLSLLLVRFLPYVPGGLGGPDEWQHYGKNVQFIMEHHRLPVSGQDDIDSLSTCRDNPYGQVPCLYSYQFTPSLNYIVSAMTARLGEFVGLNPLTGARLASVAWGVLFILGSYLLCRQFLHQTTAVWLTAIVAAIPQIIFIASYVNQDIHSLAIATWLVYTSVAYLIRGQVRLRWLWYISFGLLFSAKYNYMLVALIPIGFLIWQWWINRDHKQFLRHVCWLLVFSLILSGGWYVRNWLLYEDLTGMNFVLQQMTQYHALGVKWSLADIQSYLLIFKFDAFNALFASFFSNLGYLVVKLDESYYTLLKLWLFGGLITLLIYSNLQSRRVLLGGLTFLGLALGAVVINALTYDFQFQGRYLFVVLPVLLGAVAYSLAAVEQKEPLITKGLVLASGSIMGLILLQSALGLTTHLVNSNG